MIRSLLLVVCFFTHAVKSLDMCPDSFRCDNGFTKSKCDRYCAPHGGAREYKMMETCSSHHTQVLAQCLCHNGGGCQTTADRYAAHSPRCDDAPKTQEQCSDVCRHGLPGGEGEFRREERDTDYLFICGCTTCRTLFTFVTLAKPPPPAPTPLVSETPTSTPPESPTTIFQGRNQDAQMFALVSILGACMLFIWITFCIYTQCCHNGDSRNAPPRRFVSLDEVL